MMQIPKTLAGLLVHMLGDSIGARPAGAGEGGGVRRARERLAAKRKANEAMAKGWPERPMSRQVQRAQDRAAAKLSRSVQKASALRNKVPGGAAEVS